MKITAPAALLIALAPAFAFANECKSSTDKALAVTSWSAEAATYGTMEAVEITVNIRSLLDHGVRMIDGHIRFSDALGRGIIDISIDDDANIPAGGEMVQTFKYRKGFLTSGPTRLITMHKDDAIVTACVSALVRDDGTIERFD